MKLGITVINTIQSLTFAGDMVNGSGAQSK